MSRVYADSDILSRKNEKTNPHRIVDVENRVADSTIIPLCFAFTCYR